MKDLHTQVSMTRLCGLFDKSRQAFHQRQQVIYEQAVEEHLIVEHVRKIRTKQPRIGSRKLMVKLEEIGIRIGRDALFDVLRNNGLLVRRRRNSVRTTQSSHWLRKYPNLIRQYVPPYPNRLWVSDITYLETTEGYVYLFLITDDCSKKIIGFALADNLESDNAVEALKMALKGMKEDCSELIHHSDRGVQYCSDKYVKLLQDRNIRISMTENGDPLENAVAERVNGILKDEWLRDMGRMDKRTIYKVVPQVIRIYNEERPHLSLDMLTPDMAHLKTERLRRRWKNYYPSKGQPGKPDGSLSTN